MGRAPRTRLARCRSCGAPAFNPPKQLPAVAFLLSSPLIWCILFDRKRRGRLTRRRRRTPAAPNAPLSVETCTHFFDSSSLPSVLGAALLRSSSLVRGLLLTQPIPHGFPHISSPPPSLAGLPCQQPSVAWEYSETRRVCSRGLNFLSGGGFKRSEKCLRLWTKRSVLQPSPGRPGTRPRPPTPSRSSDSTAR